MRIQEQIGLDDDSLPTVAIFKNKGGKIEVYTLGSWEPDEIECLTCDIENLELQVDNVAFAMKEGNGFFVRMSNGDYFNIEG